MAWLCDDPTSFDVDTFSVPSLPPSDRVGWYQDGSWYRPTANGDTITFAFTVDPGNRGYINVRGYNDNTDRGFDVRVDGGAWMHENGTGGPTGDNVTLLSVPNVVSASYYANDYGTGWDSGIPAGSHTFELRAAYATNPTNLVEFQINEYADCPVSALRRPVVGRIGFR